MEDERARVLRMVAEGKISPEEAADLLEALSPQSSSRRGRDRDESNEPPMFFDPPNSRRLSKRNRYLIIHIKEGGESKVNVRIPLSLTKAAGKFIPRQAMTYLNKYEINLSELLDEMAGSDGGTLVEVKDGDNKVLIAVE
ncbi:MAG: SHOCT-like domain-containing protein [Chloroflexota bacterium]